MKNVIQPICGECGEGITNPICHECIRKEVLAWLSTKAYTGLDKRKAGKIRTLVSHKVKTLYGAPETGINCIICKESLVMCSYCFVRHIKDIFAKAGVRAPALSYSRFIS